MNSIILESLLIPDNSNNQKLVKELISICKHMATFEYICIDKDLGILPNTRANFDKHYTVTISDFKKCNGGICYDYVNYMVKLLKKFKIKTFFNGYIGKDKQIDSTHTYILVYINSKIYWIEDSWKTHMGIYEFDSEDDAISYITNIQKNNMEYFTVEYKPSSKLEKNTIIDFINNMNRFPEYSYNYNKNPKMKKIYSISLDNNGKINNEKVNL